MSSLADALFTNTQQKVLGILYGQTHKSFYLKEILRLSGMGVSSVKSVLASLLEAGIITKTNIGNQHHYQANAQCPIFEELLGIVKKTVGLADIIHAATSTLENTIELAFIFGSIASNKEHVESDIDLLVISDDLAYADLMSALHEAELFLGRPINPSIYSREQFIHKLEEKNSFVTRIWDQPKLWIKGSMDALGRITQSGQDK